MEAFFNYLKSFGESANEQQTNVADQNRSSNDQSRNNDTQRRRVRIQGLEDDDEEFQARDRRIHNNNNNNQNANGTVAFGIGIAALAIGTYAVGKLFFDSKDLQKKLCVTKEDIIEAIKKIEDDSKDYPVVGMDCQWKLQDNSSSVRNKVALLQLCSRLGNIALIPISKIFIFPEELKEFLRNSRIIKVGIETRKDAKYLIKDYGLNVGGTYDIRFLAQDTGHQPLGLENLSKSILDLDLGRDWELISSDWDQEPLDDRQISYAEKSVKASVDIFKTLIPYAITSVTRNEILNYCYENLDSVFTYYSQNY